MKHLFLPLFCLFCCSVFSQNIVVNGIEYKINTKAKTASVVSCQIPGIHSWEIDSMSLNVVTIPKYVTFAKVPYKVTSIADTAFAQCPGLVSINFPSTLLYIGNYAFQGCSHINEIVIPSSVKALGDGCFSACENLSSVSLPVGLKSIPANAFSYCTFLDSVFIPASVTDIGDFAFASCVSLVYVAFPPKLNYIGASAFVECGFDYLEIPPTVTKIASCAFLNCIELDSIIMPSALTSLGDSVFFGCMGLQKVYARGCLNYASSPDGQMFYAKNTGSHKTLLFYNNNGELCILPDSFNIAAGVFRNNTSLRKVKLPGSLKSIGDYAFEGCTSLIDVYIPAKVRYIGKGAFIGCNSLRSFNVFHGDTYFTSDDGKSLFQRKDDGIAMIAFVDSLPTVFIPSFVTELGYGLFYCHYEITNIFIPRSVKKIGALAFYRCSRLNGISLPEGITVIPDQVFDGCESIGQIVLPTTVTSLGSRVFCNCSHLGLLVLPEGLREAGFSLLAGYLSDHLQVVSLSPTPASLRSNSFIGTRNVDLHVPKGSADKYRESVSWGKFRNIIDDL
ncbi:MAG: leucine-rich repeat domain-containing protein [Paludibacteraceae bacterium]|nr:leucine-rich repeat domain-containing protein [Paludibacteraceae bacterium]